MSEAVLKALAVTAELTGTALSKPALNVLLDDLSEYGEQDVLRALAKCRKEVKGRLTLSEILARIETDDDWPSANEAWSIVCAGSDEWATVVSNDAIGEAWSVAGPILYSGDDIGARLAFRDAYERIVKKAREQKRKPKWFASLGADPAGRKHALELAVRQGRLGASFVAGLLPPPMDARGEAIAGLLTGKLAALPNDPEFRNRVAGLLANLRGESR